MRDRDDRASAAESWNYGVFLTSGIAKSVSRGLCSPRLALPFLLMSLGGAAWVAATLLPLARVAVVLTPIVAVPILRASRTRKGYLAAGTATSAAAFAGIGYFAQKLSAGPLEMVFLLGAFVFGAGNGLNSLAFQDLMPRLVSEARRTTLLFYGATVAGALSILIAWGLPRLTRNPDPVANHLHLLYAGLVATAASALLSCLLRDPGIDEARRGGGLGYLETLRRGLGSASRAPWFRRLLIQRALLQSVEVAMPFYAIHAATLHVSIAGSLNAMVVGSSAGAILAGLVWRRVAARSTRRVMGLASLSAMAGGLLAIALDLLADGGSPLSYSGVAFLVVMGSAGSAASRVLYLSTKAPSEERPFMVALGNAVAGVVSILVGLCFGLLGHLQHAIWPIALIVALNLVSALHTLRLESEHAPS